MKPAFKHCANTMRLGANSFGMVGKSLEKDDPNAVCDELRRCGCSVISLQLYEAYLGKIIYQSARYPDLCLYRKRDFTGEYVRAAKEAGLAVWFWADERGFPRESILYDRFRDCIEADRYGAPSISWYPSVACCINSRWRDFVSEIFQEALTIYPDVEGIIVSDEAGYFSINEGYDLHCREKFRVKYGVSVPSGADLDDSDGIGAKFVQERFHWWTEYIDFLCRACKAVNANVQTGVLIRHNGIGEGPLYGIDGWEVASLKSLDWIGSSAFFRTDYHDHALYQQHSANLVASLARRHNKKSFMVVPSHRNISPQDAKLGLLDTALGGADIVFYFTMESVHSSPAHQQSIATVAESLKAIPMDLPHAHNPQKVALLFSRRDWMGYNPKSAAGFFSECLGLFECFRLCHLPTDLIFDEDVRAGALRAYDVLVTSRRSSFTEEEITAVKGFIGKGGRLVLTLMESESCWTSPMAEFCQEVMGFTEFGCTLPVRYLAVSARHDITNGIPKEDKLPISYAPGALRAIGLVRMAVAINENAQVLLEMVDDDNRKWPAMLLSRFGMGYGVTLVQPLGALFHGQVLKSYGYETHWLTEGFKLAQVLARATRGAEQSSPGLEIKSSIANVSSNVFEDGDNCVVALVNHSYLDMAEVQLSLPRGLAGNNRVQVIGEECEVSNLPTGQRIINAMLQPSQFAFVVLPKNK